MVKLDAGWKEIPRGGLILEAGNAVEYLTGEWRAQRPVLDPQKCINCLTCWIFCPDASIVVREGKMVGFDLEHCKGCGICSQVCPKKVQAITMVEESKFAE